MSDEAHPEEQPVSPEPKAPPEPSSQEALEKAEELVSRAQAFRVRGDAAQAEDMIEAALRLAPDSVVALEALGDSLRARRQMRRARDTYDKARKLAPTNANVERKYAEVVLAIAGAADPTFGLRSSGTGDESIASVKTAAILSMLIPGLGQIVSGRRNQGLAMLGGWVLGLVLAFLVPNGIEGLLNSFRGGYEVNGLVFPPLFLAACCHLWSIFDGSSRAKQVERRPIERPVPPVDEKFEL